MVEPNDEAQDELLALAAAMTAVRGRLVAVMERLPEETEEEGTAGSAGGCGDAEEAEEDEGPADDVRSMVSCVVVDSIEPAIRDLLFASEPRAAERSAPPRGREEHDYSRLFQALFSKMHEHASRASAEAREGRRLLAELLSMRPEKRLEAIAEARFGNVLVVRQTLDEARKVLLESPAISEELAALASTIARSSAFEDVAKDGAVTAACRTADSRRLQGDLESAEVALSAASLEATEAGQQAELARALALVRWEQGRVEEALALLERAAERWEEEEDAPEEAAACRVLDAILLAEEGRAAETVSLLRGTLDLLADLSLGLWGEVVLTLGLAEKGLRERARARRKRWAAELPRGPEGARLYGLRLEAEVALSLEESLPAAAFFEEMRREALGSGWLAEAAIATLRLAQLDDEIGGAASAAESRRHRSAELAETFRDLEIVPRLVGILDDYPSQKPESESLRAFTSALAGTLLRLLRRQGVPRAPLPFA